MSGSAPAPDWKSGRDFVARAYSEIDAAENAFKAMGPALGKREQAGKAGDAKAINDSAAQLRQEAQAAQAAANGGFVSDDLKAVLSQLDTATKQAGKGEIPQAQQALRGAADQLVAAKDAQLGYGRFVTMRDALQARADKLSNSTQPPGKLLQAKIDPIRQTIAIAERSANGRDWGKADEALRKGDGQAEEANTAAVKLAAFNTRAAELVEKVKGLKDPLATTVRNTLRTAAEQAKVLNMDDADRSLDKAEVQIEGAAVTSLASTPNDPKFKAAIQKIVQLSDKESASGGAKDPTKKQPDRLKELDDIVSKLPDNAGQQAIAVIAKERFGVDLSVSAAGDNVQGQTQTAKNLYKTLAMTPDQVRNNPSLKKVTRTNLYKAGSPTVTDAGGAYASATNETTMQGRPKDAKYDQQFGSKLLNGDGSGPQLPPSASNDYKPANEDPIDYFEFANVHETGHSVDDRLGFMKARAGQAQFGGWTTYGGNLGPIADAVAGKYGAAFAAELKDFVLDLMTGNKPANPKARDAAQQPALNTACDKIRNEWYANANVGGGCWWDQGKCTAITIGGTIYHEAYAGTWVSYPASERAKGITGYQFRAPGEWFAELFAAYHHKKLKPSHPAVAWLKDL